MAENLAYLPEVCNVDEGCGFYVYGYEGADLQLAKATENYHEYGVLYNYLSASDACPVGWHLPSKTDWDILENTIIRLNWHNRHCLS